MWTARKIGNCSVFSRRVQKFHGVPTALLFDLRFGTCVERHPQVDQGLARFRADRLSSPTAPLWLLIDCGGLDVPVVVGEKNSSATGRVLTPKRLEAVPLCGGCARVGGNKKLLSHL